MSVTWLLAGWNRPNHSVRRMDDTYYIHWSAKYPIKIYTDRHLPCLFSFFFSLLVSSLFFFSLLVLLHPDIWMFFYICWCKHLLVIWFTCMVNMVDIGKYWKIINEMTNEVWRISNLCFFQFYMKRALIGFATEDTEASYIRCISTKSDPLLRSIW